MNDPPTLLYDGSCGFCAASVQFVLRHERTRTLMFAPLDGAFAAALRLRHPDLAAVDSMMWVEPGSGDTPERVVVRSAAALRVAAYLGGPWRLAALTRILPSALRDRVYDLVARHRHHLFQGPEQCYLPPPDARARFRS